MDQDEERTEEIVRTQADAWHLGEVAERGRLGRALAERLMADEVRLARLALNPTLPADLAAGLADPQPRAAARGDVRAPGPGGRPALDRAARRSVTYRQRVSTSRAKTTTFPS